MVRAKFLKALVLKVIMRFIISPHLCISTSLLQEQKQAKAYNIAPEFKRIVEWRYQLLVIKTFLRKKGSKN